MADVVIRLAGLEDGVEIARLTTLLGYPVDAAALESRLARLLGSTSDVVFVADAGPEGLQGWIHGFLSQLLESDFRVEIGGLIVDPRARRGGIGTRLVGAVGSWAREHGAREVSVRCREERKESHLFYEGLGFVHTKTQKVFRKRPV